MMSVNANNNVANGTRSVGGDGGSMMVVPVDLYSVVLSAAGLVLATLLGGGGSLTVLLALFRSPRIQRYSYTLLLVFFFLALALDVVWAPLELGHLLTFHLSGRHPTSDLGVATFVLYILLLGGVALLLAAFCLENVLRLSQAFHPALRKPWPLLVVVLSLLVALAVALGVACASLNPDPFRPAPHSYLVLDPSASKARVAGLTLLLVLVVVGAGGVVTAGVLAVRRGAVLIKPSHSFLSGQSGQSVPDHPHHDDLPPYTPQPGCSTSDDQASASPCSSKLPDILEPDVTVMPAARPPNGAGLHLNPAPASKGPTMLGVNMAQVGIMIAQ
jgi:hypothetical protein